MPYTTKQYQAVLSCLSQRQEPISAAELGDALRTAGSPVGFATIYRQLDKLERGGLVHRVDTAEGALYQYCPDGPARRGCFMLRCEGCGRILHLECTHLKKFYEHLESEHHFVIDPRSTVFSGLCDRCSAEREARHGEQ